MTKEILFVKKVLSVTVAVMMLLSLVSTPGIAFADDSQPDEAPTEEIQAAEGETEEPNVEVTEGPTDVPTVIPTEEIPTEVPAATLTPAQTQKETATTEATDSELLEETLTPTITPTEDVVGAQGSFVPTPIRPSGTVYTTKPTFEWTKVEGATYYHLYVYKVVLGGVVKIYRNTYRSSVCGNSVCSVTPTTSLGYRDYQWKVRADVDEEWRDFSEYSYFTTAGTTTTAKTPSSTIYTDTPTFSWVEIEGSTQYEILVYNSKGKVIHEQYTSDFTCEDGLCSVASSTALNMGSYKWRVRAFFDSKWRSYSDKKSFIVAGDIDSNFEDNASYWSLLSGGKWFLANGSYYTDGKSKKMTNLKSTYIYTDVEVQGRVMRGGGSSDSSFPANYICVRMSTHRTSQYLWYTGYVFGYTNAGNYSILRMDSNGAVTTIQPWTDTDAVNPDGWNDLRVVAEGEDFSFYINDTLVNSFTDSKYSKGYAGFEMYNPGSGQERFYIDSAAITVLDGTSAGSVSSSAAVDAEQQVLNQSAQSDEEIGSILGYSETEDLSAEATTAATVEVTETEESDIEATATDEESTAPVEEALDTTETPTEETNLSAQGTSGIPPLIDPSTTIYTRKPTFSWNEVEGASSYYLYVYYYNFGGIIRAYRLEYGDEVCIEGICSVTPSKSLSYLKYKWRVQAYDGTDWSDFSDYQYFEVEKLVPTAKTPNSLIYSSTPDFTWSEILNADQYNIVVYNAKNKKVLNTYTSDFTCSDGICSLSSEVAFSSGSYKWRVRAYLDENWSSFGAYQSFTVANAIDSDFENNKNGWSRFAGANWKNAYGYYYTDGQANRMSSAKYTYKYSDFTITARVKRAAGTVNSSFPASYLAVRMGTDKTSELIWYTGYIFGYTNAGTYSIWRMGSSGSSRAIQPWTTTDTINKDDWNDLKVKVEGSTFQFYINDTLVNTFIDNKYSSGYVGFEMYRPGTMSSRFYVDSVKLDIIEAESLSAASLDSGQTVSAQQQRWNQEAWEDAEGDSLESYTE
jgi:hypothetical protein